MAEPTGDINVFAKILDWGWAGVVVLCGMVYKSQDDKIQVVSTEIAAQRQTVETIFSKLDESRRRAEDRHIELLNALHVGLDRKADK